MNGTLARLVGAGFLAGALWSAHPIEAQVGSFSRDDLIDLTALWKGERFPTAAPRFPRRSSSG